MEGPQGKMAFVGNVKLEISSKKEWIDGARVPRSENFSLLPGAGTAREDGIVAEDLEKDSIDATLGRERAFKCCLR